MELEIVHNRAVELLCSLIKYSGLGFENVMRTAEYELVNKVPLDFTPNPKIKEWLQFVDSHLSVFQKNDIELITRRIEGVFPLCIEFVVQHGLETPEQLIALIALFRPDELIERLFAVYRLGVSLTEDEQLLQREMQREMSEESAALFLQVKKHPEEFQQKLVRLLQFFLESAYQPFADQIEQELQPTLYRHNLLLANDPIRFLNVIGLGDYTTVIEKHQRVKLYLSHFLDLGMLLCLTKDTLCFVYGCSMEERFSQNLLKEKCRNLFKALSDEKRLEIIKLTSQRAWYNKELADYFGLTTATLSYHLNLLLDLGILSFVPISNRLYYSTNKENLRSMFAVALEELV